MKAFAVKSLSPEGEGTEYPKEEGYRSLESLDDRGIVSGSQIEEISSRFSHYKVEDNTVGAGESKEPQEPSPPSRGIRNLEKQLGTEREILTPPENFSPVINKIYRSSFPQENNFTFLKRLKLRAIVSLIPEDYPPEHEEFFAQENIIVFRLGMSGNKEPFVKIPHDLITEAIKIVLSPENQPILIHCNRGKHRTGCLVGVLRRLQRWSLALIFDEYRKFAAPKERPVDQQFIELYNEAEIIKYAHVNNLLPLRWD